MTKRATVVVVKNTKVLLIKENGESRWSFPSGVIKEGESIQAAARRELQDSLGFVSFDVRRLDLCDIENSLNQHKACFVPTLEEPNVKDPNIVEWVWWNMKEKLPLYDHVNQILDCIRSPGSLY